MNLSHLDREIKAITMANRGRSTKIADSIGSASVECGRYWLTVPLVSFHR